MEKKKILFFEKKKLKGWKRCVGNWEDVWDSPVLEIKNIKEEETNTKEKEGISEWLFLLTIIIIIGMIFYQFTYLFIIENL